MEYLPWLFALQLETIREGNAVDDQCAGRCRQIELLYVMSAECELFLSCFVNFEREVQKLFNSFLVVSGGERFRI